MGPFGQWCRYQWLEIFGDVRKRPPLLPAPPPGEAHWHVSHGIVTKFCKDPDCPGSEPYNPELLPPAEEAPPPPPLPSGVIPIPAGTLQKGDTVHVRSSGEFRPDIISELR